MTLPPDACHKGALGYYSIFMVDMLAPAFICIGIYIYALTRMKRLRDVTMPLPEGLAPKDSFVFKLKRSVLASDIQANYYSLIFFIVFIRCHIVVHVECMQSDDCGAGDAVGTQAQPKQSSICGAAAAWLPTSRCWRQI